MAKESSATGLFSHEESPLFAVVSTDGLVKVWDTSNSTVVASRPADLSDPACCIAWEEAESGRQGRLAVGTTTGVVAVFNVESGVDTPLGKTHDGAVTALSWVGDDLFSGGRDKMVCKWDVEKRTAVHTFQAADSAVGAICGGMDDALELFTAGTVVKGWGQTDDAEGPAEAVSFTGHAGGTGYLCANRVASHVVTAAINQPDDNLVYGWPRKSSSSKRRSPQPQVFAAPAAVSVVDVAADGAGPDGRWAMAAVCDGAVHVYVPPKRTTKQPQAAVGTVTFVRSKKKGKGKGAAQPILVLSVCFSRKQPATHVLTARGTFVAPVFEEVAYAESDGAVIASVTLPREATNSALDRGPSVTGAVAASAGGAAADATIIAAGAKAVTSPQPAAGEVPFGEQVVQLGLVGTGATKASGAVNSTPTARSLAHMLAQALHSNDQSLLEECLSNTNEGVVRNTVSRLPPVLAVKFLTDVVAKLEAKPNRGALLMVWIRAVLLAHASYLMTVPDLPKVLAGMYNLVDARLAVFPRLLKLSGRLDLLLSQVVLQNKESDGDEVDMHLPVAEFVDDDESDSEASDGSDDDEDNAKDWEMQVDEEEEEEEDDDAMENGS